MREKTVRTQFKRAIVSLLTAALVASGALGYDKVVNAEEQVSVKDVIGDAYGYGIFVSGTTNMSGDSEANVCTNNLIYNANIGYSGVGTMYVHESYTGSGNHIRCSNLILGSADFSQSGDNWYVNGVFVGNSSQIGRIDRGSYDIPGAMSKILENAKAMYALGTDVSPNNENKYVFDLADGQNILKISNVSWFQPKAEVSSSKTLVMNIAPGENSISVSGQDVKGIESYPDQVSASLLVWNFGEYDGTINITNMFGTIIAPNATVILSGGNLCGRVIAANYTSGAETHFKGSTWYPPVTTTEPPVTTTQPPVTTTEPPVTTTQPPVTTTQPPVTTTQPPVTTTQPPVTTTQPPVTTTQPPVTTTQPPVTTTQPPVTTTQPPVTTTQPPVTTTQPPVTTTQPPVTTTQPPVTTTQPPVTTTQPPVTTTQPPVTTTQPPVTTTQPPVTTTQPPVTTTQPPVTTTQPPVTTTQPPVTTTQPPVTTTQPPVTTTQPPVVTTNPPVPTETPEVLGDRRIITVEDEETPLADGAVLGSRRRPQTGDESNIWTVAFLASLSGLAAWILQGRKK